MKSYFKNFLKFTFKEKVMMILTILLLVIRSSSEFWGPLIQNDTLEFESWEWPMHSNYVIQNKAIKDSTCKSLFTFNPNTLSSDSLIILGFNPKLAERIVKYRKYYPFKQKEDLKKIYGLSSEFFEKIKPYIHIESNEESPSPRKYWVNNPKTEYSIIKTERKSEKLTININKAAEEELMLLDGIGFALSKRIANYREKLGGFKQIEQLLEVYGIDSAVWIKISPFIYTDKMVDKVISINTADVKELSAHPYISYKEAKLIFNYRLHHGKYNNITTLYNIQAIDSARIEQMAPYIKLDE